MDKSLGILILAVLFATEISAQTAPPRYYLPSRIFPGQPTETRTDETGSHTVGNHSRGFGCSSLVTRNGLFLRNNFQMEPLCPLPGDVQSTVTSFETEGDFSAVGCSTSNRGVERPVQWIVRGGAWVPMPVPLPADGTQGCVHSTDQGARLTGDIEVAGRRVPVYWPNASSLPIRFPIAGSGQGFRVRDFSGEPVVAGVHAGRAFLWYPGRFGLMSVVYPLGTVPSDAKALRSINGNPVLAGSRSGGVRRKPTIFGPAFTTQTLPALEGDSLVTDFRPAWNQVIGTATNAQALRLAVLWENGVIHDLNRAQLPVCRANHPELCAPMSLQSANSIASNGLIAAEGTFDQTLWAVLLRPIGPYPWTLGACARIGGIGTGCDATREIVFNSTLPHVNPDPITQTAKTPDDSATSTVGRRSAYAAASARRQATTADSVFHNFVVIENRALGKLFADGRPTLRVNFHFQVTATASTCKGPVSIGGVSAKLMVQPATGTPVYEPREGGLVVYAGYQPSGYGILSNHPSAGSDFVVPVTLKNSSKPIELVVEGRARASFSAGFGIPNPPGSPRDCVSGSITVRFNANDPGAITLDDGTTLASHGVPYVLWPGPAM